MFILKNNLKKKIFLFIGIFTMLFNNFSYADLIDPDFPNRRTSRIASRTTSKHSYARYNSRRDFKICFSFIYFINHSISSLQI